MSFLRAAEILLELEDRPLTPQEITSMAQERRMISTGGATPVQTMKAKLSTDIVNHRGTSTFMRSSKNTFALRRWTHIREYVAPRFKKRLLDEEIVVFPRTVLRDYFPHDGVTKITPDEGQQLVDHLEAMQRRSAEEDAGYIQLVSQFVVIQGGRVACHKRTRRLPESRLHGVHSILFGGHLNPDDISPLFPPFSPGGGPALMREFSEEIRVSGGSPHFTLLGGIYDPRTEVSRQHVGVLYRVDIGESCTITIGERGFLQQLTFETASEVSGTIDLFDNWSELVFRELVSRELTR